MPLAAEIRNERRALPYPLAVEAQPGGGTENGDGGAGVLFAGVGWFQGSPSILACVFDLGLGHLKNHIISYFRWVHVNTDLSSVWHPARRWLQNNKC